MLTERDRAILKAVCDTVVPAIERDRDSDGHWGRSASDLGVDQGAAQLIEEIPDPALRAGLVQLLQALGGQGIGRASQLSSEQILRNVALSDPQAAAGVAALINMTLFLHYGGADPATGQNPNWRTFGYPGPVSAAPEVPKPLRIHWPEGLEETLDADVCIVGSGSGGAVVAATLAERGLDVVVLEAAGYFNESDFDQLELSAYEQRYWRGGPTPTAEGNVSLVAGTTLGGGTTINWTNCLRTRPWVREQWAGEHGLDGVDGPAYDAHLDAVLERIGARESCSDLNGPQQRMKEGAEALGWSFETIVRNTDLDTYSPEMAGYLGFGDQSGSKQSADRTWLADAQEHGATFLTHCRATRVLAEGGRATGVEAVWEPPEGGGAAVTVRAPRVVVACGSLESPALLLRSGIGGPARRRLPPSPPLDRRRRPLRDRPEGMVGRAAGGALRPARRHRRRLRRPDRDRAVRARADRLGDPVDLRRRPQAADGAVPLQRHLHRAHPRSRPRASDRGRHRRGGARLPGGRRARPGEPDARGRGPDPAARGGGRPPDLSPRRGRADLAPRRGPRRLHRAGREDPLPRRRPQALQRPPDGDLPDGHGPRDVGRRPARRAPRRQGRLDRRRQRLPDLLGHQPDGLDHGAGTADRRRDRRRRPGWKHPQRKE